MGITRAQYLQGDSNDGPVLSGTVQGITDGAGVQIDSSGVLSLTPATTTSIGGVIPDGTTIKVSPTGVISTNDAAFFRQLDDISYLFDGIEDTFNLTAGGDPYTPVNADNLIISLGGVLQLPGPAFTVSGSTITFDTPPEGGTTFAGYTVVNGAGGGSGGGPGKVTLVGTGVGLSGGPIVTTGTISLDVATTTSLGGVIPDGTTIQIHSSGVISAVIPPAVSRVNTGVGLAGGPITSTGTISLDTATTTSLGGVIPDGTTITVTGAGVISAVTPPSVVPRIVNLGALEAIDGTRSLFTLCLYGTATPYALALSSNLAVFLGGVPQLPGTSYTVAGNKVTFVTPPPASTDFLAITVSGI